MRPAVVLACGCQVPFTERTAPRCATHGATRVLRTVGMPAPRIRGTATGPHVETVDLGPWLGRLAGGDDPGDETDG